MPPSPPPPLFSMPSPMYANPAAPSPQFAASPALDEVTPAPGYVEVPASTLLKDMMFAPLQKFATDKRQLDELRTHLVRHTAAAPRDTEGAWRPNDRMNEHLKILAVLSAGLNGVAAGARISDEDLKLSEAVVIKTPRKSDADALGYEYLMGRRLNQLRRYMPHFSMTMLWFKCTGENNGSTPLCTGIPRGMRDFLVVERVEPGTMFASLVGLSPEEWLSIVLQVLCALQIAQDRLEFTHYDLHDGNVLIEEMPRSAVNPVFVYQIGARRVVVPVVRRRCPVIIDYGRAHMRRDPAFLARLNLPSDMQSEGELQISGADAFAGIDMCVFNEFHDMVVFVRRAIPALAALPRDLDAVLTALIDGYRYSTDLDAEVFPVRRAPSCAYRRPIELVDALMRTAAYANLVHASNIRAKQVYVWNSETSRGPDQV